SGVAAVSVDGSASTSAAVHAVQHDPTCRGAADYYDVADQPAFDDHHRRGGGGRGALRTRYGAAVKPSDSCRWRGTNQTAPSYAGTGDRRGHSRCATDSGDGCPEPVGSVTFLAFF